jgi:hypothetical protein
MGQIIMEQAEVVEGVVDDAPLESQPALGVLVLTQSILHVSEETRALGMARAMDHNSSRI